MRTWLHLIGSVFAIASLGACSSSAPLFVERLDTNTGVTVLNATEPLVLYRDNSGYAAHARDYIYMGPIEVHRMGAESYYLWLGIWSTMRDATRLAGQRDGFESVVIYADGEPMQLEIAGWTLDTIGVSAPVYPRPVAGAADAYYRVTADQIRLITDARDIELRTGTAREIAYILWDQQSLPSTSLQAFVRRARN